MCKDCGCSTVQHRLFSTDAHPPAGLPLLVLPQKDATTNKRRIEVEESLFEKNQSLAKKNREVFAERNLKVFNVMSSPGAGKTTLLTKILPALSKDKKIRVMVGDQATSIDADRLRAAGVDAIQINTHSACHLDADRIAKTLEAEGKAEFDWLVIENVGNLVCPAVFDLGENIRVAILSTAEGEEKPLKYPVLFSEADLIIITKSDLLPHLDYDPKLVVRNCRTMNSRAPILFCSSRTGEGLEELQKEILHVSGTPLAHH
jgi:hydrogenase nickel incorporation protein HypB